jgi:O-antigen/teichoic acid export membrane protein
MSLKRATGLGVIQSVASMAVSFLSVKITSVFLGPAGIGMLGQLQNFITMSQGVLVSGLATSVVRRTAESRDDPAARARVLSTTMRLVVASGVPVALIIAAASGWLARELLHDASLRMPLLLFALVSVAGMLGLLITGAANGARDYRTMTLSQIGAGVATLILFAALCPTLGIYGGLIAGAMFPATNALVAWLCARNRDWWPSHPMAHGYSKEEARAALTFVPMAAVRSVSTPLVQIMVRDALALQSGMAAVGLLHGVIRLSDIYITIATSVFGMYFLPRFAEVRRVDEIKRELKKGVATVLVGVTAISLAMYLLRDLIVHAVFTPQFYGMRDLFGWQMAGNVMKLSAWFLSHLMVAKGNPLLLVGFEIFIGLLWWGSGVYMVHLNGAVGATQAYAFTHAVYLLMAAGAIALLLRRLEREEQRQPA